MDVFSYLLGKKDGGGSISNMDNYTEEEQVIGTWIDGKTLYRKVLIYENAINSNTLTTIGTLGTAIDKVISINTVISNSAKTVMYASSYADSSKCKSISTNVSLTDGVVVVFAFSESWSAPILISTIIYTKATSPSE